MNNAVFVVVCVTGVSIAACADACPEERLTSSRQVVECAEKKSPEVQFAIIEVEQARAQIGVASQWKNPEFTVDSVGGKSGPESASETEIMVGVPVELGGKIGARRDVAGRRLAQAKVRLSTVQANVRKTVLLKLHRLRQLTHEKEVIEEAIGTFSKLVSQYANRPKLSPEQEISVVVFRMSQSEYDLKKAESYDEFEELNSYFLATVGKRADELKGILPSAPKSWPKIDEGGLGQASPLLREAEAELATSMSEYLVAKSESWPTVIVGPSLKLQKESGRSDQLYGLNLSLPLPVFSANGAGRAAAAVGVRLSEARVNLARAESESRREELTRIYTQSVSVLDSTLSHQEIERRHRDTEKLFLRGIVPSSLVIEAHRTLVELEKSRNEREMKALDALYSIQILSGESSEMKP